MNYVDFSLTDKEMYAFAVIITNASEKNIKADITKQWCKKIISKFTKDWS